MKHIYIYTICPSDNPGRQVISALSLSRYLCKIRIAHLPPFRFFFYNFIYFKALTTWASKPVLAKSWDMSHIIAPAKVLLNPFEYWKTEVS